MKRVIGLLAVLFATAALAQTYPTKPVKIVLPYSVGSGPDIMTRLLAEKLSSKWDKPVIVESKPGASGFIAIRSVKKSPPDGHELLIAANGHMTINPAMYRKLPYDPEEDFTPVAMIYRTPVFLAVSTASPYQTIPELIAAAKAKPGELTYGSTNVGSPTHLGSVELESLTGTKMIHVPFKDQSQAFIALANGELTWMFTTHASALPMIKAGRIKLLAVVDKERHAIEPAIPTLAQAGGPADLDVNVWLGLFAKRGTPSHLIEKINGDINRQLTAPQFVDRMRGFGWEVALATPQQLTDLIRADTLKNAKLVRRSGAQVN